MAFNAAAVAQANLQRFGTPVIISFPNVAFDATDATRNIRTFALIQTKANLLPANSLGANVGMSPARTVTAMLPIQSQEITGATLTVNKRTYTIASATEEYFANITAVLLFWR